MSRLRAEKEHAAESPVPAAPTVAAPRSAQSDGGRSLHSGKFKAAIAALLVAGIASLAAAVALTSASGGKRRGGGGSWSAWQPGSGGLSGAQEVADYVSPYYRASSAYQLAIVTTVNLNDPSSPLQVVIPTSGSSAGYQALDPNSTIAYNLCGIGSKDCSIGVGTPSSNRLLLLRREALELALYSFKYLGDVQTVVAILPPGHTLTSSRLSAKPPTAGQTSSSTKPVSLALAFDRKELQTFLNRPLRETLPEALPPTVTEVRSAPESELVSVITAHGLFQERTEQAQDGSNLVVLTALPPQ
jgi:hypothetical protein